MKRISLFLTVLFSLSNCVFAYQNQVNFLNDRKIENSLQLASLPAGLVPQFNPTAALPRMNGTTSSNKAPRRELKVVSHLAESMPAALFDHVNLKETFKGQSKRPIILIEDIHENVEAQKNISKAIQSFGTVKGQSEIVVGLEGAHGGFLYDIYKSFPNQTIAKKIADDAFESGKLSGPAHAGFVSRPVDGFKKLKFVGVDDDDYYVKNVNAYKQGSAQKAAVLKKLNQLKEANSLLKEINYTQDLKNFDSLVNSYREGTTPLTEFAITLSEYDGPLDFTLETFIEASKIEKSIDFKKVDQERKNVLEKLVGTLKKERLSGLIEMSISYQNGLSSFADYYKYLKQITLEAGVQLNEYLEFDRYIQYVLLSDGINAEALFTALEDVEAHVLASLLNSNLQKRIAAESNQLYLTQVLLDFSLTSSEWASYRKNKNRVPLKLNVEPFEEFYIAAEHRNEAMVKNLMASNQTKDMETPLLLVAGGFHSLGITQILKAAGQSYIKVSPKVTEFNFDKGTHYLSAFDREKSSLEKIFQGKKLFVAAVPSGAINPAVAVPDPLNDMAMRVMAGSVAAQPSDQTSPQILSRLLGAPVSHVVVKAGSGVVSFISAGYKFIVPISDAARNITQTKQVRLILIGAVGSVLLAVSMFWPYLGATLLISLAILANLPEGPEGEGSLRKINEKLEGPVWKTIISPNGKEVVSASREGKISIYPIIRESDQTDIRFGEKFTEDLGASVSAVELSPSGNEILLVVNEGLQLLKIIRNTDGIVESFQRIIIKNLNYPIKDIGFRSKGEAIWVGAGNRLAIQYELLRDKNGGLINILEPDIYPFDTSNLLAIYPSPNRFEFLSQAERNVLSLQFYGIGNSIQKVQDVVVEGEILAVKFHPQGNKFLVGTSNGKIYVFTIKRSMRGHKSEIGTPFILDMKSRVELIDVSSDGTEIIVKTDVGLVSRFSMDVNENQQPLKLIKAIAVGSSSHVSSLQYFPNSTDVMATYVDGQVQIFSNPSDQLIRNVSPTDKKKSGFTAHSIFFVGLMSVFFTGGSITDLIWGFSLGALFVLFIFHSLKALFSWKNNQIQNQAKKMTEIEDMQIQASIKLVTALYQAAPSGPVIGHLAQDIQKNAELVNLINSKNNSIQAQGALAQAWLMNYLNAGLLPYETASQAIESHELNTIQNPSQTIVSQISLGEIEEKIVDDLEALNDVLMSAAHDQSSDDSNNKEHNVIILIHAQLTDDQLADLDQIVEDHRAYAVIIKVDDSLKSTDLYYDADKIFSRVRLTEGKDLNLSAIEKIADRNAEAPQYRVFTRVPSQFRVSDYLRNIWVVFANLGHGWTSFGPGSLQKIVDLAEEIGKQA